MQNLTSLMTRTRGVCERCLSAYLLRRGLDPPSIVESDHLTATDQSAARRLREKGCGTFQVPVTLIGTYALELSRLLFAAKVATKARPIVTLNVLIPRWCNWR